MLVDASGLFLVYLSHNCQATVSIVTGLSVSQRVVQTPSNHIFLEGKMAQVICFGEGEYAINSFPCLPGGPLCDGDIEEADGVLKVFCPWHDYDFELRTGKSGTSLQVNMMFLFHNTDFFLSPEQWHGFLFSVVKCT